MNRFLDVLAYVVVVFSVCAVVCIVGAIVVSCAMSIATTAPRDVVSGLGIVAGMVSVCGGMAIAIEWAVKRIRARRESVGNRR